MPVPIQEDTIKLVWENTADTPITSSSLSKSTDFVAGYRDYEFATGVHGEGTIFIKDPNPPIGEQDRLIMKRETVFSIVNLESRIPINKQYKLFDIGLEDLYIRVEDQDDNPANPQPPKTSWGSNTEWFVFLCDSELEVEGGRGSGQILVSRSNVSPQQTQVPGNPAYNYTSKSVRLLGGFKVDVNGSILAESVWDISGKNKFVKAKKYYVINEFSSDSEDPYNRHLYRPLRVSDLDSSSSQSNVVESGMTIQGDLNIDHSPGKVTINTIDITSDGTDLTIHSSLNLQDQDLIIEDGLGTNYRLTRNSSESGIHLKPALNPSAEEPLFSVQNSGGTQVFRVENAGAIVTTNDIIEVNGVKLEKDLQNPTGTENFGVDAILYATEVHNAVYNDLAEYFVSRDKNLPGLVYVIEEDGVLQLSSKRAQSNVAGICSDSAAYLMKTELKDEGTPIALAGSVKAWCKTEIKAGDEVVSDSGGYVVKANFFERIFKRSAIIGKALESNKDKNDTRILIMIK